MLIHRLAIYIVFNNIQIMSYKAILTFLNIVILSLRLFSQTDLTLIDSLKSRLTNSDEHTKVEILNELSQLLINTSFDKSLGYAEEALYLAKEGNNKKAKNTSKFIYSGIFAYRYFSSGHIKKPEQEKAK